MADRIRVGVIGVGQQGERHVKAYAEMPADVEIVAVADPREDVAARVAREHDVANVYTDYRELLRRDDIAAVDVIVHNRLHAPIVIEALNAGKDVYVEKPIAATYREAREMVETARALGRKLHVQLGRIYRPNTRAAKRLVDGGHLGEIYHARSIQYRRRGRPFVDGYGTRAFVNSATSGGGVLLDYAVYSISQMLYLLGNPEVLTVSGSTSQRLDNVYPERHRESEYDVEELGIGVVRLAGGVTLSFEAAWAIHGEATDSDFVYGSHAGLKVDPLTYYTTLGDLEMNGTFDLAGAERRWLSCDPRERDFTSSAGHWIAGLLGRVPLIDTAGLALNTALVTEGVYRSGSLGREVTAAEIAEA